MGSFGGDGGEFLVELEFNLDRRLRMVEKARKMNSGIKDRNHKEEISFRKFDMAFA